MASIFDAFREVYPPVPGETFPIDGDRLAERIQDEFLVRVPGELVNFWNEIGGGYFADREIYVFGDGSTAAPRNDLISWNKLDLFRILPRPKDGGPLFFAETCFGMQYGYRWESGEPTGVFLIVDTLEAHRVADEFEHMFTRVLSERFSLTNARLLSGVRDKLGDLPPGKHYAPKRSPLNGGSWHPDNFKLETPIVHLSTTVAEWEASR